jgi:peptidoglycan hydrolase FlgJ
MTTPSLPSGNTLFDPQRLNAIKSDVQQADPQALKVVAQQFESFFLKQILQEMHNTTFQTGLMGDPQSGALGEYTQWMDTHLADTLSQHGLGLSDALLKQWMQQFQVDKT